MKLKRREILEQLIRLGIREVGGLKGACREFEAYWESLMRHRSTFMGS